MRTYLLSLFALFLIAQTSSLAQSLDQRHYYGDKKLVPREHAVDFTRLRLEVSFEPKRGLVKGAVNHSFKVLQQEVDSIFLDAISMDISAVTVDQKKAEYKNSKKGITVYFKPALRWDTQHDLNITYTARPKKGIYFVGWNETDPKARKQIWTQGQGIDNRHWIPMYDTQNDKVSSEMYVTFDSKYKVLSNGRKVSEKRNKNGTTTWNYVLKKPHPTYLIMLGIGDYEIKASKSKSGVPMYFWYYPDWKDRVESTYKYSEDIMDFFEAEIGVPYPWGSYSQIPVQEFMYGAMENTTATIFGDFYFPDARSFNDKNYVRVNAHELAHQWFGDMVTARTGTHHWLQESFATHYDLTYQKRAFGEDHFNWQRKLATDQAVSESRKNYKPIAHSAAGTVRHYPKGAHVLQMLKYVVGREAFNKTIKHYLNKHAYQNVDSEDLLIAFHETLGISLDWFWEEWIYKGGEPHYQVSFREVEVGDRSYAQFDVEQVHLTNNLVGLFKMPIFFEVHYKDGSSSSKKVWIEDQQHTVEILNEKKKEIAYVLFDPNSEVMKVVNFQKPFDMLVAQLEAKNMIDRYDAVKAMASIPVTQKREALTQLFEQEPFHAVKEQIIRQLFSDPTSKDLVKKALKDDDVNVRKAVVNASGYIPEGLLPEYQKLLSDNSYQLIEITLAKLCFLLPEKTEEFLELTKNEVGVSEKNIRIKWLEIAYNENPEEKYIKELVDYTSSVYEFKTRVNAANKLVHLNYFNEEAMKNMVQALFSFNRRLSGPISKSLDHFYKQTAYKKMIFDYVTNPDVFSSTDRKRLRKYMIF